ncbi:DUF2393 family protein [Edaphobacter sp.]|uniref:DUF2393 family protein n=1 Tax=Edaphobacter sp. TaxID=1934404 RepID=UPI002DBC349A|nr:DUF2393 family protein [Edaphobacter sp.]HEU5342661.1 DUF2393 family protein [Edaphobacter sp.]
MSEEQRTGGAGGDEAKAESGAAESAMFQAKPTSDARVPVMAWVVAGVVVLAVLVALVFAGRRKSGPPPNTLQPLAAYAANLPLSQFSMSESTSYSGGKSTFVDGHIHNGGSQTVTGIMVQVIFRNDEGLPPRIETLPMALIRTREPYIDTQPVAQNPLKPGDDRDFRLIFESIPDNWNYQMPEVRVIQVETK